MKKLLLITLVCIIGLSIIGCTSTDIENSNEPPKSESTNIFKESNNVDGISINKGIENQNLKMFHKYTEIFGIRLYATKDVPDEKLVHASKIMAGYLDNNLDGKVDNKLVVNNMIEKKAIMVMFKDSSESEELITKYGKEFDSLDYTYQDLYADETHPEGSKPRAFDASLEEVLHLITHSGYAYAYPGVFGEKEETEVAKTMDIARGGYFKTVPIKYPENAWYSYYDKTADYSTMITEYIYWALTSMLGAQEYEGRLEEIQHEWKLNTKEKVTNQDPKVYKLLTDEKYKFPKVIPDGKYKVSNN